MATTQEKVYWYALTTLARVRDRLDNPDESLNPVLTRMINSVTDYIERECGRSGLEKYPLDGHFALKQYVNEVYSVNGMRQDKLIMRNAPVTYITLSADLVQNSAVVNNPTCITGVAAGMPLYNMIGLFPLGTTVLSVDKTANTITMSQQAQVTQLQAQFEISGLISFQWRAGTPSAPSWTPFITDQFELVDQGTVGEIRVYGVMPRIYSNMLRATYWAGFALDWPNAGNYDSQNRQTHLLPSDLTDMAENLIERRFGRRGMAGKTSEAIQGATTAWDKELDSMDKVTIQNYRRLGVYF